jgi:23S rRNA C2498 (ribose-2'-O)-methylase RlmM
MATEKVLNYTAEQTAELVAEYTANPTADTVKALADKLGKTVKSVVAKLAKEGVYHAKAKEAGKREMLKSEMVAEIAKLTGKTDEQLESLEKATSPALKMVLDALHAMAETIVALKVKQVTAESGE